MLNKVSFTGLLVNPFAKLSNTVLLPAILSAMILVKPAVSTVKLVAFNTLLSNAVPPFTFIKPLVVSFFAAKSADVEVPPIHCQLGINGVPKLICKHPLVLQSLQKTINPVAGLTIEFFCASVIRGAKNPLLVSVKSKMAELSGEPVPIPI